MAKTNNEKIEGITERITQLEAQKRKLLQQQKESERKARTRRLIERGAIVESMIDNAVNLTNEEFMAHLQIYLPKTATTEKTQTTSPYGEPAIPQSYVEIEEPDEESPF